jgi:hypothetical protein
MTSLRSLSISMKPVDISLDVRLVAHRVRDVLIFAVAKTPDFVALNPLSAQADECLVLKFQAGFREFASQLLNRVLRNASDSHGRTNRVAFNQAADDSGFLFASELIHVVHYA